MSLSYTVIRIDRHRKNDAIECLIGDLQPKHIKELGNYVALYYAWESNYRIIRDTLDNHYISSEVFNNTNWYIDAVHDFNDSLEKIKQIS